MLLDLALNLVSLNLGQMLISVRASAELMNQLCRHKVKDKMKGYGA